MPLASGALTALVAVYVFVTVCAVSIRLARPRALEHGALALHFAFLVAHAALRIAAILFGAGAGLAAASVLAMGGGLAVHLRISLTTAGVRGRFPDGTVIATGTAFALLAAGVALAPRASGHDAAADALALLPSPGSAYGLATTAATALLALAIFFFATRRALAGAADGLVPLAVGDALLALACGYDLARGALGAPGLHTGTLGLFAASAGSMGSFILRYATVERELDRRTAALSFAEGELRTSRDALRRTSEELERKAQLAVVGELAAVVAHEVRNPLAVITNAVSGLRRKALSREDQEVLFGILEEEAGRLNGLVSDLLGFARPVSVQRTRVAIKDIVARATTLASEGERKHEIAVDFDAPPAPEATTIYGDAGLLRQVFDNLVSNAIQAMPGGGKLRVTVARAIEDGEEGVRVDVIDTGDGMDTIVRARARDPFFTTRPSGTGLGLAIVDRIVEAHGGHFLIESLPGEGTTVSVFLPDRKPSVTSVNFPATEPVEREPS